MLSPAFNTGNPSTTTEKLPEVIGRSTHCPNDRTTGSPWLGRNVSGPRLPAICAKRTVAGRPVITSFTNTLAVAVPSSVDAVIATHAGHGQPWMEPGTCCNPVATP